MKFQYTRYGQVLRPVIPIKRKLGGKGIGYHVLVDSGADLCFFDAGIGEAVGIKVSSGAPREVFGIGGKVSIYYIHKVTIEVGGWPFEIEAGFMPEVAGRVVQYGLVGQKGLFDKFTVKFDLAKQEIELEAVR